MTGFILSTCASYSGLSTSGICIGLIASFAIARIPNPRGSLNRLGPAEPGLKNRVSPSHSLFG